MSPSLRVLLVATGLALLAAATWAGLRYRHDLDAARERISGRSQVLQTRWGRLEYAVAGDAGGPALLMIHGTGGGHLWLGRDEAVADELQRFVRGIP